MNRKAWLLLFFKGMAMGAADVVPGVSGGTIAFITGIYTRFLSALKSLTPMALKTLVQQGFAAFWREIDGYFLLVLFSGILLSILSLANIITYLLENFPILVWSFFFGLVIASAIYLLRQMPHCRIQEIIAIVIGAAIAIAIAYVRPAELPAEWWMMMIAGAIAICAMILPGISGSFILLLMGMYTVVINAIQALDIALLVSFAVGCFFGLIGFSHLLSWLLKRFEATTYALLTGFLVGSLNILWPWKQVLETFVNRHDEVVPLVQRNVLPMQYTELNGEPSFLLGAIVCMSAGLLLVLLLEKVGQQESD